MCHVKNFVAIGWLKYESEQNERFNNIEFWWKNRKGNLCVPRPNVFFAVCCNFLLKLLLGFNYLKHNVNMGPNIRNFIFEARTGWSMFSGVWRNASRRLRNSLCDRGNRERLIDWRLEVRRKPRSRPSVGKNILVLLIRNKQVLNLCYGEHCILLMSYLNHTFNFSLC